MGVSPPGSSDQAAPASSRAAGRRALPSERPPRAITGTIVGALQGLDEAGRPLVDFPGNASGRLLPARTAVPLTTGEVGRELVLTFDGGSPLRPIVLGLLLPDPAGSAPEAVPVQVDGRKLVVSAQDQLVLRCGEASITLTSAGKVLIRGDYVLSRSSGVNCIKGASVQIN